MASIVKKLIQFISEDLDIDCSDVTPGSLLFSSGIIDSFSLVSLLRLIEEGYAIEISFTDVNLDNFDSLERMAAFIEKKLSG